MNPSLSKNIAEAQLNKLNSSKSREPSEQDLALTEQVVKKIASFRLGRKYAERSGLFICKDQGALIESLNPSAEQRQFLASVTLKLRVKIELGQGEQARSAKLLYFNSPESDVESGKLLETLALGPADMTNGSYGLFIPSDVKGPVLPGSQEFEDIVTTINSFKP